MSFHILALLSLSLFSFACATPDPMPDVRSNLSRYEEFLKLSVESPDTVQPGTDLPLTITLKSTAMTEIEGCWYRDATVHITGVDTRYFKAIAMGTLVDHPYCGESFRIKPGGSVTFTQTVEVPSLPPGEATILVSVTVVYPRRCGRYGCYDTEISGRRAESVVVRPASN